MGNCNERQSHANVTINSDSNAIATATYTAEIASPVHKGSILSMKSFGDSLYTCSDDQSIRRINCHNGNCWYIDESFSCIGHTKAVNRMSIVSSNNYTHIFSASRDLSIRHWQLNSNKELQADVSTVISDAHTLNIADVTASNDGTVIYTGSRDYSVKVWDVAKSSAMVEFKAPRNIVTCLMLDETAVNPMLYQGSEDLCIRVWDTRSISRQPSMHITGYVYFPLCIDISQSSNSLVATGSKGFNSCGCEVKLWDKRNSNKPVREYTGHTQDVVRCMFIPDSVYIISASKDGSIYVWDTTSDSETAIVASLTDTGRYFTCLDITYRHSNECRFSVGSIDGSISFYTFNSDSKIITLYAVTPISSSN